MTLQTTKRKDQSQKLIEVLNRLQGVTVSGLEEEIVSEVTNDFFVLLEGLSLELLPYAAVSQFVYSNDSEDLLYFIDRLEELITEKYYEDLVNVNYNKGIKLIEHIELAQQQKDYLFLKHEQEIKHIKQYTLDILLKTKEIQKVDKEIKVLNKEIIKVKEDQKNILTNFISILGIFAAILMGAFGSIHSFTNLFKNAHTLTMGKILILSSVGASSVILILFFLLNGIAKLTERRLWSTQENGGTLIEKHPALIITHGFLILIALIGAALELSNVHIKVAWQALWWLIPILWFAYLCVSINQKRIWPFSRNKNKENK